jgi:hypothetical protein
VVIAGLQSFQLIVNENKSIVNDYLTILVPALQRHIFNTPGNKSGINIRGTAFTGCGEGDTETDFQHSCRLEPVDRKVRKTTAWSGSSDSETSDAEGSGDSGRLVNGAVWLG